MDRLLGFPSIKKMRLCLEPYQQELSKAYESGVERIDAQPEALREMAHRLIKWIVHAETPLRLAEVTHAFAIEPKVDEIDE